ncbi:MAG: caspase family protein, partial [Bacteroidota bacterium]
IRKCKPKIERKILRELSTLFEEDDEIQLGPEYEPTEEPRDEIKEAEFALLQEFVKAGLVEPFGEKHMYYAAKNSKKCRLTDLGKYYRDLGNRGLI